MGAEFNNALKYLLNLPLPETTDYEEIKRTDINHYGVAKKTNYLKVLSLNA